MKTDIESVIGIELKGLMPMSDSLFHPDDPITRFSYAMILEDIISTLSNDDNLRTKFIGYPSAFKDVDPDLPYFNAIMVCTTRGIMEPVNFMEGLFQPEGYVSGADALLIIRKFKETLKE